MKFKTSELTGAALDWAVAKCEVGAEFIGEIDDPHFYSTDWAHGGPIIERECINLFSLDPKTEDDTGFWLAHMEGIYVRYGVSAIVAAMRCYVASKLGDEVEIPEELNQ